MIRSNIVKRNTNHGNKEVIKSLLVILAFYSGIELEAARAVGKIPATKAEIDLENPQPKRRM